ncbi:MAG: peptidylprolyl isomerase [Flavobacteriales bacterium]|nr:peptidylprolyl isomerase [Flavobacteriales bacterium]
MRRTLPIALLFTLGSCTNGTPEAASNRWADERLWPVLEAQEHRDTGALCALLKHEAAEVREAAALAFASVQDTLAIPCLLEVLRDEFANVRSTALYALGFVADSLTIERMAKEAMTERDSAVQRAYLSASFLAMQRSGMLKDPAAIIYFLQSSSAQDRVRAADALRRLPDSARLAMEADHIALVEAEQEVEVKAMLVRGMGVMRSEQAKGLVLRCMDVKMPQPLRINAMRAFTSMWRPREEAPLLAALVDADPVVRHAALEELGRLDGPLAAELLMNTAVDPEDAMLFIPWYGLLNRHGLRSEHPYKGAIPDARNAPYAYAEWIRVVVNDRTPDERPDLWVMLKADEHAAVRQAVFQALVQEVRDFMATARFASVEAQYAQLGEVVRTAMTTGDAGLISAAAELLLEFDAEAIRQMLDAAAEQQARAPLLPIRDLEARLLLDQVAAKRDGLPPPKHAAPTFNHPIDPAKLRALPQGQRYRITTSKGTIILATDVNDCPGSSLAFDSLVSAGYYDGKAFHRMVPNFVVQGGCPRGDGYGGMPWTLRTEIGRKPFTAGSVGLASAGRDTESCQFFITHSATPHLDGRYTRFAEVVEGMDVVWRLQVGDVMEKVERVE